MSFGPVKEQQTSIDAGSGSPYGPKRKLHLRNLVNVVEGRQSITKTPYLIKKASKPKPFIPPQYNSQSGQTGQSYIQYPTRASPDFTLQIRPRAPSTIENRFTEPDRESDFGFERPFSKAFKYLLGTESPF